MVVCCGVQPLYFLDEMQPQELDAVLNQFSNNYKNQWEQVRFISYIQASCFASKGLKPQDLIRFTWEQEQQEILTPEEFEVRKKQMLEETIKALNNPNKRTASIKDFS